MLDAACCFRTCCAPPETEVRIVTKKHETNQGPVVRLPARSTGEQVRQFVDEDGETITQDRGGAAAQPRPPSAAKASADATNEQELHVDW